MNLKNDFIIIDIETAGFSADRGDQITEIAAIHVEGETLSIKNHYSSLVKIKGEVPQRIVSLTGITTDMLVNHGIDLPQAMDQLSKFCGDMQCFAHNANFDKSFIRFYLEKTKTPFINTEWVDTISIFKNSFPDRETYKLESLIKDFNLATKEDHRALSDAKHTLSLLKIAKNKSLRIHKDYTGLKLGKTSKKKEVSLRIHKDYTGLKHPI